MVNYGNLFLFIFYFSLFLVSLQHETETDYTNRLSAIALDDHNGSGLAIC